MFVVVCCCCCCCCCYCCCCCCCCCCCYYCCCCCCCCSCRYSLSSFCGSGPERPKTDARGRTDTKMSSVAVSGVSLLLLCVGQGVGRSRDRREAAVIVVGLLLK